jgi:hypothetical protein
MFDDYSGNLVNRPVDVEFWGTGEERVEENRPQTDE